MAERWHIKASSITSDEEIKLEVTDGNIISTARTLSIALPFHRVTVSAMKVVRVALEAGAVVTDNVNYFADNELTPGVKESWETITRFTQGRNDRNTL